MGTTGGVIIPLWISDLLGQIGTPEAADTAAKLSGAFVATAVVEMARRAVTDKAGRDHRAKVADEIEKALRHNPPVNSEGSPQAYLSQFFTAQVHAFFILTGELPQLVVGVGGFLVVLVLHGVSMWAILMLILLIAAAGSVCWALRNSQYMKNAAECENKQVELFAAIRSAWGFEQFQAALARAQKEATARALEARRSAHKFQHTFVNARAVISGAVGVVVTMVAVGVSPEVATLLIVFGLRLSGQLALMHYVAEFLPKINVDAADLLAVMRRPVKPRLQIDESTDCVQTSELSVVYKSSESVANVVPLSPVRVGDGGTVLFTRGNGGGKTSFFRAVVGLVPYAGSLKLWGQERRNFDVRHLVAHFSQVRIPLPVTVRDLFVDDDGRVDLSLVKRALAFAHVPVNFNLDQMHNGLSGGQQQGIDLALTVYRAWYVEGVRIVIFDEPTNNLDVSRAEHLRGTLKDFQGQYSGCQFYTTHDPSLQKMLRNMGCAVVN